MNYYDSPSSLHRFALRRRYFNPADRGDLKELKYFKLHNKWKNGCPFYLIWPHADIVSMCNSMFTEYMLKKIK